MHTEKNGSEPNVQPSGPVVSRSLDHFVRRPLFGSDYSAAIVAEGIAFAGLCIGLGICHAEFMWTLVIIWAFSFGPSKDLRKPAKPTPNPTGQGMTHETGKED
jgi:hypothetical protein